MQYISTRGGDRKSGAAPTILAGLAGDGGLFVPADIPRVNAAQLAALRAMDYTRRAETLLGLFFEDMPQVGQCIRRAYARFDIPVRPVAPGAHVLELWRGPTAAFKDVALQFLPLALEQAKAQQNISEETVILVATSGDTGGAALNGFGRVPGMRVAAFYPKDGVSDLQRLQMTTDNGPHAWGIAVDGNFDDTQRGVKAIFSNRDIQERLAGQGYALSSANSINWGRLAPQIVYYFSAWCDLVNAGALGNDEPIDFVVPTGNFGNILAGWYAREMGLPIGRLVCASNRNHVLSDFFADGVYDARREFHKTISPSMDILVSSNLERLLFELSGRDAAAVRAMMSSLNDAGTYSVDKALLKRAQGVFDAGYAGEDATRATIRWVWEAYGYLLDPHTAVAWNVWEKGRRNHAVIVSTASPYKFASDVMASLDLPAQDGAQSQCRALYAATEFDMPQSLARLWTAPAGHNLSCGYEDMPQAVETLLGHG